MTYPAPDDGLKPASKWVLFAVVFTVVGVVLGGSAGLIVYALA